MPDTAVIRKCRPDEMDKVLAIVNAAAEAYRGVIPDDCWREPYMPARELEHELAAGVAFWGGEIDGGLAGVMGVQPVREVDLIRHAYVLPGRQRSGIGGALLEHQRSGGDRPVLVGTWAAAHWAVGFYQKHGFQRVPAERTADLLRTYWTISARQAQASVVLANPPLDALRMG